MAAPLSSLFSIPRSIRLHLCTSGRLLLLTVFAWSQPGSVMAVVRCLSRRRSAINPIFAFLGKHSEVHTNCLQEVQTISCATLFAPVLRVEAVQAMSA